MPRFDEGEQNLKLIKGNIVLMGNPDQYGEILAENIFVEDITRAALQTLISGSNLVRGKYYRITNAVGSTLSLVVKAVTADVLDEVAVNSTNGDNVIYNITTDVATVPYADTYVPYTGATTNVDLGEFGLDSGFVTYDTTPTNTPTTQGTTYWDANEETIALIMNGATQHIGLDTFYNAKNSTGTTIPKGTAVRFAGTDGNSGHLLIAPMLADGTYPSEYYMGITAEAISNGDYGKVIQFGKLRGFNTNAYNAGDILYVSSTVAGEFQTTPPTAPNNIIIAAAAINSTNNGTIMVRATIGSNINNDEGVKITTPTTGQLLQLQSNGLWENKTKAQVLGGTSSQFVKGDGTLDSTNYLSTISGISAGGELSGTYPNPSLVTSAVTGKPLTGLSVSGSAVVSTDSILTGIGKLQNQINAVVGSVNFQGVWNASTNSPSLASGVGTKGYYYVVSVPGSTNLDGITDWKLGDWAIYDGTAWQKVDNTDAVVSVNGYTGIVTLAKADIGLGNVENTALSTWAGSTNITTLGTIGTGVWNGTAIGDTYISSASTWNAKIGGSGTTGKLAKFTASGAVGDSIVSESGGVVDIAGKLNLSGTSGELLTINGVAGEWGVNIKGNSLANNSYGLLISAGTSVSDFALGIFNQALSSSLLTIRGNGQLITYGATNTGEAHIFGGTSRFNGSTLVNTGTVNQNLKLFGDKLGISRTSDEAVVVYFSKNTDLGTQGTANINGYDGIQFRTQGVETVKMTITSTGNVLIGTTTDTGEKLQVTGTTKITGNTTIGGNLTVDTNTLFVDATNNKVGIGTTSPLYKFNVVGDAVAGRLSTTNMDRTAQNLVVFTNPQFSTNASMGLMLRVFPQSDTRQGAGIFASGGTNNGATDLHLFGSKSNDGGVTSTSYSLLSFDGQTGAATFSGTAQFTKLGLGTSLLTSSLLRISSNLTGGTSTFGNRIDSTIQSDSTTSAYYFQSVASTAAASFNVSDLTHFFAQRGTIGAGSSITNQYAFRADSNIIGATNNYGFYSDIASATGRWNFYANGTANNYFNGNVQIGSTTATAGAEKLQVTGTASVSGALSIGNTVQVSVATPSTHKVTIVIGGVTYYLLATNV